MAKDKRSFIIYADFIHSIEHLNNEQAGKLFKHILQYVNDFDPIADDPIIKIAFEPIRQQLKRDLKKWKSQRKKRSDAGRKGGLKTQANFKQNQAMLESAKANQAVNETVNVNVNDNVNVNVIEGDIVGEVFYDVEDLVKKNELWLENTLMKIGATKEQATEGLRKYHLFLEERSQYPKQKKALLAGFEKWMMNEKKFSNGTHKQTPGTSQDRVDKLKRW